MLTGYVYVDITGHDPNGCVEQAAQVLQQRLKVEPGYTISWSGQYEAAQRVRRRMMLIIPLTLFLVFLLLYTSTRSFFKTMIVGILAAVPFSAIGAVWLIFLLGYNMSVAVWVGMIAAARSRCGDWSVHAVVSGSCL